MNKLILNTIIAPSLLIFSSFTSGGIKTSDSRYIPPKDQTYKEFMTDAYNFRLKNNLEVPDFYYDVLEKDNPNTPAWAKQVALPPLPKLRDSIPLWVRKGQLMTESSSSYNTDDTINYVNKKRGGNNNSRGAIGPFQVLRIAFDHMKKENPEALKGRRYEEMQKDTKLNEEVACMYLLYIYNGRAKKNWDMTVMMYNRGPWGQIDTDARNYLRKVKQYGNAN